jgi:hypothetical protein
MKRTAWLLGAFLLTACTGQDGGTTKESATPEKPCCPTEKAPAGAKEAAAPAPEKAATAPKETAAPAPEEAATAPKETAAPAPEKAATAPKETAAPAPEEAATAPKETAAEAGPGQKLFAAKCASCHKLPDVKKHSDSKWAAEVKRMVVQKKAKITADEQKQIIAYLQQANGKD